MVIFEIQNPLFCQSVLIHAPLILFNVRQTLQINIFPCGSVFLRNIGKH